MAYSNLVAQRQWRALRFALAVLVLQGLKNLELTNMVIVWFEEDEEIQGNWRAVVATDVLEGTQYEVTYDAENRRASIDVWQRYKTQTITDEAIDQTILGDK